MYSVKNYSSSCNVRCPRDMVYLTYATDYSQNHKQRFKIIDPVPAFYMLYFTRNIRGLDVLTPCSTDPSLAKRVGKAVAYIWISDGFASAQYLNLMMDIEYLLFIIRSFARYFSASILKPSQKTHNWRQCQ